MPLGSAREEVGVIWRDGAGLLLQRDDGGVWRLDGPHDLGAHLGRRVTIAGVRSGFDRLEAVSVDGRTFSRRWIFSREFALGALTTLAAISSLIALAT